MSEYAPAAASEQSRSTTSPARKTFAHQTGGSQNGNGYVQRARRRGQVGIVIVLIVALVCAGFTRQLAEAFRDAHAPGAGRTRAGASAAGGSSSLAGMDTYTMALLLGGLRGPLVMILWANSENQKADRDLEGIDTQIEWIRRLQPEFDTVHVFQMWNKAYNISVQMVGLSNKYATILDAIDYGRSVDEERPDNINIMRELARIYADKLGMTTPEKHYYREQLRKETKYRKLTQTAQRGQPGFQRLAHDPVLDERGNIMPQFLEARFKIDPNKDPLQQYDGSDLQFLKQYEPFPYGVSPFAMGYNYYKRAQVLMATSSQKPIQIGESVLDSQPALSLKSWAEEEWERGRRMEITLFGMARPSERLDQETPTQAVPVSTPIRDAALLDQLLYSYEMVARLADDSLKEYERHLSNPEYATKQSIYASHMDTITGMRDLVTGDREYLLGMHATKPEERADHLRTAALHYHDSIRMNALTAMRYFISDRVADAVFPKGITRANIGTGNPGELSAVTEQQVVKFMADIERVIGSTFDDSGDDRHEYQTYINRATARIAEIDKALKQ